MNTICYLFIFIFEQFISYLYFKSKYEFKRKTWIIFICYFISFIVQYTTNLFNSPYLNLLSFFVCNLSIVLICFSSTLKQSLFDVVLLEGIMITTEVVIMYLFSSILEIDLLECKNNELIIFLETAATKILYFIIAYIISIFSKKADKYKSVINKYSVLLFLMPVSSILVISSYAYLSFNYNVNITTNFLFAFSSLIMLISNIIIFIIHERIIDVLIKNTELELEKQKLHINEEYYIELEKQYDSSNILIHDIKKCLGNIKGLLLQNDNSKAIEYIDSIYDGYDIKQIKKYSNNKLINVIVSRYAQLCYNNNIEFSADIRDVNFSFIKDSEITALFDNLFENAFEATKKCPNKFINIEVDYRNENYIFIKMLNSINNKPLFQNGLPITTKKDKKGHGIGIKSILKIVKKYYGNLDYTYIENENIFVTTILLKST